MVFLKLNSIALLKQIKSQKFNMNRNVISKSALINNKLKMLR